jgi:hypothetical protein
VNAVTLRCALLRASKGDGVAHPSRLAEGASTSSDERSCAHAGMTIQSSLRLEIPRLRRRQWREFAAVGLEIQ